MSVQATLEGVSASLVDTVEKVKKLQSISAPHDIVEAVKSLNSTLGNVIRSLDKLTNSFDERTNAIIQLLKNYSEEMKFIRQCLEEGNYAA